MEVHGTPFLREYTLFDLSKLVADSSKLDTSLQRLSNTSTCHSRILRYSAWIGSSSTPSVTHSLYSTGLVLWMVLEVMVLLGATSRVCSMPNPFLNELILTKLYKTPTKRGWDYEQLTNFL